MATCDIGVVMQILAILGGCYALIISFVILFKGTWSWMTCFACVFGIFLGLTTILVELYVFDFFKYFAFIFRSWGKSLYFLFMGVNFFTKDALGIASFVIFILLAIFYLVIFFMCGSGVPYPLLQRGGVTFSVTNENYTKRKRGQAA